MKRVIAHLDMDAFFAAVEQRDNPSLKGKPVVIGADPKDGQGRGVVSTCSYEARPFGIHSAMPISKAYQLCPQAFFLRGNHQKYRDVSRQIFQVLSRYTDKIQPISIDEAFMDISGTEKLFGSPLELGRTIKKQIQDELGLNASIGIAPIKMLAKILSDDCKPNGLRQVREENVLRYLWPLRIEKIWGVGKKTKESLHQLKIFKVEDLAKYPLDDLIQKFGEYGVKLHYLANGRDDREVEPREEIKSVSHEHTFETDVSDSKLIHDTLFELSQKVAKRLRRYDLKGRSLSVKIRLSNFKTFTRAHQFSEFLNFPDRIYQESKLIFDRFYQPGMTFRLIGVRVSNFHNPYLQTSLFDQDKNEKKERLYEALDDIQTRFGEKGLKSGKSF